MPSKQKVIAKIPATYSALDLLDEARASFEAAPYMEFQTVTDEEEEKELARMKELLDQCDGHLKAMGLL